MTVLHGTVGVGGGTDYGEGGDSDDDDDDDDDEPRRRKQGPSI